MLTNKVVIVRHGESTFNKQNLFCGWHDSPLSKKGIEDSYKIAALNLCKFNIEFDCAYTSVLKRANQTLDIILKELKCEHIPIFRDWRLNERHYGNLTGFNKREMADQYGEDQVQKWRRCYEVTPPPISKNNPYYYSIRNNTELSIVPFDEFPKCESMKATYSRVIPVWRTEIIPKILRGHRVLVVVHGTVARALLKYLEDISDDNINTVNIPNSIPCLYNICLKTGQMVGEKLFLADEEYVKAETKKVAKIGK